MKGEPRKLFLAVTLLGIFLLNACTANGEVVPVLPTFEIQPTATPTSTIQPTYALPKMTPTISPTSALGDQTATPTTDYFPYDDPATETPLPTSTSPNGALCDNSAYIADVTFPDGSVLEPGQEFKKTWRLQNIGTCSWSGSYSLNFVYGNQMNGARSIPIGIYVLPGQQIDVSVKLTAPNCEGNKHTGYWQLADDSGRGFGARLYVVINVKRKETPLPGFVCTPVRTPTP
jgi:hypothetical protein